MAGLTDRFKRAWNAFRSDPVYKTDIGYGSVYRQDKMLSRHYSDIILAPLYNKIAIDVSMYDYLHVLLDEDNNYKKTIDDDLNKIFTTEANIDQGSKAFLRDLVLTMFETGVVALPIIESLKNPTYTDSFTVCDTRVGIIKEWMPQHVKIETYNEIIGKHDYLTCEKRVTPIIENPFYMTMNEPNSTAKRLTRVLAQLDRTNEQNSAGKIDMLIQLPYSTRTKVRKEGAEARRKELEDQMTGSQYGIGYIDSSEKVIQLNRSVENNLWDQATKLEEKLYKDLGYSPAILDGTAKEEEILNYQNTAVKPIVTAICDEITRKWISKTARTQGHAIKAYSDPFKLVTVNNIADIADKFTRNEIMSSNELRTKIGLKPSDDPKADQLINSNLNHPEEGMNAMAEEGQLMEEETNMENGQNQQDFTEMAKEIVGLI